GLTLRALGQEALHQGAALHHGGLPLVGPGLHPGPGLQARPGRQTGRPPEGSLGAQGRPPLERLASLHFSPWRGSFRKARTAAWSLRRRRTFGTRRTFTPLEHTQSIPRPATSVNPQRRARRFRRRLFASIPTAVGCSWSATQAARAA